MLIESKLIERESTVRLMKLESDVKLTRKSIVRWLVLALGLIAPNETRTLLLEVFEALLVSHFSGKQPNIHDIAAHVKKSKEVSTKAINYHLLQLKRLGIIDRNKGKYRFVVNPTQESAELGDALEQIYVENSKLAFVNIKKMMKTFERAL
ncbi:hypothetical protein COX84_03920 [Candidatus Micrarchaeota archaeon CG_4_10_14_0_2_um_filter_49_7]|nr:MAG: hypothetical protein COS70_02485 [Candidatus Micrarchaeota archaeon CG06_land_8_20_14_3_00_50_6]PIZ96315.1 MAG: hypothetical protein COX84_03920 [Candidatus Micrarchaeota archaeon CG_4_10_14_0_2_um_filter_49_7]